MSAISPGGCACGAIRFKLKREPMIVHCCHCTDCQRETGSAFVINALIERDEIKIERDGGMKVTEMPTASGRPHDVYRCARCDTALWSDYGRRKTMMFVRTGTLDEPARCPPDVHIFTQSKLPWVGIPADMPAFEIFYESVEAFWRPESLARRRALGF